MALTFAHPLASLHIQTAASPGSSHSRGRGRLAAPLATLALACLPAGFALIQSPVAGASQPSVAPPIPQTCGGGSVATVASGTRMNAGATYYSPSCAYRLTMQTDGNLVLYSGTTPEWDSQTNGNGGAYAVMQTTGNLAVYAAGNAALWSTGSYHNSGATLQLQNDGNLVVYSSSHSPVWATSWAHNPTGAKEYARAILSDYGWGATQFTYLTELWTRESNWEWNASNASSGAYGIPQALPGTKMASYGPNWRTTGQTQVQWGEDYILARYGSPAAAWAHEESTGWYGPNQPAT